MPASTGADFGHGLASATSPNPALSPRPRLSVFRSLWWSRERARGHFLYWRGVGCGRLWLATPGAEATDQKIRPLQVFENTSRPETVFGGRMPSADVGAILHSGSIIRGVVDAKYKSLHPSASSPNGPQRDDLYQMAAYLGRFQASAGLITWGLLAYPFDPSKPDTPHAEQNSPWNLENGKRIAFAAILHNPGDAVRKLNGLISKLASEASLYASA